MITRERFSEEWKKLNQSLISINSKKIYEYTKTRAPDVHHVFTVSCHGQISSVIMKKYINLNDI